MRAPRRNLYHFPASLQGFDPKGSCLSASLGRSIVGRYGLRPVGVADISFIVYPNQVLYSYEVADVVGGEIR